MEGKGPAVAGGAVRLTGLTLPEPFRWFPYLGARHAVPQVLASPGVEGATLCDVEVVVPECEPPKFPDGIWPECQECDREWRRRTGRPQRSELHVRAQAVVEP